MPCWYFVKFHQHEILSGDKLFNYRSVDHQLADEALVVMRRHCWYLVPELVISTLFSAKLSSDEESRLVYNLQSQRPSPTH